MKNLMICLLLVSSSFSQNHFEKFFENKTCRVDYYHTGTAKEEFYSLDQVYEEGEWSGSTTQLIDTCNLGLYLLKVYDLSTNQLIFSRGYCTVFGEWQTTAEALNGIFRTNHETVRFPFPQKPVQVVLAKRNSNNIFIDLFSTVLKPKSRFVNREKKHFPYKVSQFLNNGDPQKKIDIVLLGDGYTKKEKNKFKNDVKRYVTTLFNSPPFKQNKKNFNVWTVLVESPESGIDEPRENVWKDNPLETSYNSLDSPRYVLTTNNKRLRDIASAVPYDYIYILINSPRYGGGGIFNWFAICYTGVEKNQADWWSDYVFVHEFGHSFAGLADEYYTSNVSYVEFYPTDVEPWEPNITTQSNKDDIKWKNMFEAKSETPTEWNKSTFDSLNTAMAQLNKSSQNYKNEYKNLQDKTVAILKNPKLLNKVGCFEGAGYASEGVYRASVDCKMFSKSLVDFCPVCTKAVQKMIDFHTK
jgi:hypothetical protein